ncbi:DUF3099 domain-containing protein [Arthrobacter sp. MMS18-M83]|uniref:DUF3099 domain-containing protein n=1 Tax=Arthrobacter sp. MMS18-M83 TaxID=2996261 RepID=UPI00227B2516|nr:DUF3099 domain-containing protein [Arthrobacter sp. MMS18-M83]WAH96924.1 DUF3099 domain-containing protein [Arthrobacter sp. MMS18-M83]
MERDESAVTRDSSPLQQAPGDPDAVSGDPVVHSITDAASAHSDDMRERMIKYAVAMGIRMVCIILIFVVDGWFKIIAVAGAVFLPWIAVVIANGSDKAEIHSDALLDYVPAVELEASPETEPESYAATATVLEGELIDDDATHQDDSRPETEGIVGSGELKYPHSGEEQAAS